MWNLLGTAVKGILFLLGLVGLATLPEDAQRWTELMGPLAEYIALSRAEVALFIAITVLALWILFPVTTPFMREIRLFFKQHDTDRITGTEISENHLDTKTQRIAAIKSLGDTWELATHFLNDLIKTRTLSDDDKLKLKEFESKIYKSVEAISPGEISRFRTLGSFDKRNHPAEYQAESRRGDNTFILFSERLLRVRAFIDKHSPPEPR